MKFLISPVQCTARNRPCALCAGGARWSRHFRCFLGAQVNHPSLRRCRSASGGALMFAPHACSIVDREITNSGVPLRQRRRRARKSACYAAEQRVRWPHCARSAMAALRQSRATQHGRVLEFSAHPFGSSNTCCICSSLARARDSVVRMRLTAVATREKERAVFAPSAVPSSKERESACQKQRQGKWTRETPAERRGREGAWGDGIERRLRSAPSRAPINVLQCTTLVLLLCPQLQPETLGCRQRAPESWSESRRAKRCGCDAKTPPRRPVLARASGAAPQAPRHRLSGPAACYGIKGQWLMKIKYA